MMSMLSASLWKAHTWFTVTRVLPAICMHTP